MIWEEAFCACFKVMYSILLERTIQT